MHEMPHYPYRIDRGSSTDGDIYQLRSDGQLRSDATAGDGPCLDIELPNVHPHRDRYSEPFTAGGPQLAVLRAREGGGRVPWPVLYWFLGVVMSIGDMSGLRGPARPMPDGEVWVHDEERFTVTPNTLATASGRIEVIPGESLEVHGSCWIPWPIFRRFLEEVERSVEPRV